MCWQQDEGFCHVADLPAPCPECGGDGGFEEAGSGRWSRCTWCDGSGEVESEAATAEADDHPAFRMFTDEEAAGWEKVFADVFCPACDAWNGNRQHSCGGQS